ncbi:MAG TPA: 50S ribosomal protein L10 [Candidatus Aenigmarchaeota archaeon]|nr:50S ribosomal protein L10 [Candidatus Aenigmarchaeota archaeon]
MVSERKIKASEELKELLEKYRVIGIVDIFKLPTREFQLIKKKLSDLYFKVVKKSTLIHALKKVGREEMKEIEKYLPQQICLVFGDGDAFKIYSQIRRIKVFRYAKPGDVAEDDIIVFAGPTKLKPGPVISEFAKAKIPAGVEKGVIAVKKDTLVTKKGEKVSEAIAAILRKLDVKPISVSLNVVAIYEDGRIYPKETLELVEIYPEKLKEAYQNALTLSINICFPTKENIKYLLIKAYQHAKALESKIGG